MGLTPWAFPSLILIKYRQNVHFFGKDKRK